jgi:hypothetical protein
VAVLGLSKICAALFYRDIFKRISRTSTWAIHGMLIACAMQTVISILILAIRCGSDPWRNVNFQCSSFVSCLPPEPSENAAG